MKALRKLARRKKSKVSETLTHEVVLTLSYEAEDHHFEYSPRHCSSHTTQTTIDASARGNDRYKDAVRLMADAAVRRLNTFEESAQSTVDASVYNDEYRALKAKQLREMEELSNTISAQIEQWRMEYTDFERVEVEWKGRADDIEKISVLETKVQQMTQHNERLKSTVGTLENVIEDGDQEIRELGLLRDNKKVTELQNIIRDSRNIIERQKKELRRQTKEMNSRTSGVTDNEADKKLISQLQRLVKEKASSIEQLTIRNTDLKTNIKMLEGCKDQLLSDHERAELDRVKWMTQIGGLLGERDGAVEEVRRLQTLLEIKTTQENQEIDELKQMVYQGLYDRISRTESQEFHHRNRHVEAPF